VAASSTTVSCPLIAFLAIGDGPSCRAIPVPYRADSNGAWRSLTVTRVTLTCAHSYAVLGAVAVAALAGPFDLGRGPLEGGADLVGLTHWFMLSPKIRPGTGGTRYREQAFTPLGSRPPPLAEAGIGAAAADLPRRPPTDHGDESSPVGRKLITHHRG
jgi:hypothetical protein